MRFVTGSLLEVATLAPGPYDYIDCCGVLHHLSDPEAGLAALASVLKPEGGLGIMLYGEYGRLGVYPLQEMLRMLGETLPLSERIAQARALIAALPPINGFVLNRNLGDHKRGDAELVDLLLHPQDRAYRVEQVYELVASVPGLRLVTFLEPIFYRPETYLKDQDLLTSLEPLARAEREAFAEKLAGNRKTHLFYLTARGDASAGLAPFDDPEIVPRLRHDDGAALAKGVARLERLTLDQAGIRHAWPLPKAAAAILAAIDGKRSLADIHKELKKNNKGLGWARFLELYAPLFELFNGLNLLFHAYPKDRR
jgi:SAM-dependent methyltransferase